MNILLRTIVLSTIVVAVLVDFYLFAVVFGVWTF